MSTVVLRYLLRNACWGKLSVNRLGVSLVFKDYHLSKGVQTWNIQFKLLYKASLKDLLDLSLVLARPGWWSNHKGLITLYWNSWEIGEDNFQRFLGEKQGRKKGPRKQLFNTRAGKDALCYFLLKCKDLHLWWVFWCLCLPCATK